MSAKNPRSLLAFAVKWTTGALNATVTDNGGTGRAVALIPSGTFWTRTFLAPNSGGTSEALPRDLLRYVQAQLNASPATGNPWTVALDVTGLVKITYGGASAASITWGGAVAVGRALGFEANISVSAGGSQTAAHHPAYCFFPRSLEGDTGVQAEPSILSASLRADGLVDAWDEGVQLLQRTLRAKYQPSTEAQRTARSLYGTPFYPPASEPTRRTKPTAAPASAPASGWTVHEWFACCPGRRIAYSLYDLQDLIAGTSSAYTIGAVVPDSIRNRGDRAALTIPSYQSLVDVPSFDLTEADLSTQETR